MKNGLLLKNTVTSIHSSNIPHESFFRDDRDIPWMNEKL